MDEGATDSTPQATATGLLSTAGGSSRRRKSAASEAVSGHGAQPDQASDLTEAADEVMPDASTVVEPALLSYLQKNGTYFWSSGQRQAAHWKFFCPTDHEEPLEEQRKAKSITCVLCYVKYQNELHPSYPSEGLSHEEQDFESWAELDSDPPTMPKDIPKYNFEYTNSTATSLTYHVKKYHKRVCVCFHIIYVLLCIFYCCLMIAIT